MTPVIGEMIRTRNLALQTYRRTRSAVHWRYYTELRNYVTAAIRREKRAYLNYALSRKNTKSTWCALNHLNIVSKSSKSIPARFQNINDLNRYFVRVSAETDGPLDSSTYISRYELDAGFFRLLNFRQSTAL